MTTVNVYQTLLDKLQQQVQGTPDPNWFDPLINNLKNDISNSSMGDAYKNSANAAIDILVSNKTSLVDLGSYGLTLFMFQIGLGKSNEATETYIQALSNPDDLIALVNAGAYGVIQAKQKLDQMEAEALNLIETIGLDAAKALIPLLISLI